MSWISNVLIILVLMASVALYSSYSVEEIEPRKRGKWIAELLQNHHVAIFIRKFWDGIASIWSNVALIQLFW